MNIDTDPRIERLDPNAPKTLDLGKCQRLIRSAPSHSRFPLGDVIQDMGEQLRCAVDELTKTSTAVTDANNQMLRYQKEAETANAEVRTMQRLLGDERTKTAALEQQVATLKAEIEAAKAPPVAPAKTAPAGKRKRGRPAKVVPIETPKAETQ